MNGFAFGLVAQGRSLQRLMEAIDPECCHIDERNLP